MEREFKANTYTWNAQKNPSIALLKDNTFIVVWEGAGQNNTVGIYGQNFLLSGKKFGKELLITQSLEAYQTSPKVAQWNTGFIVVWQDHTRISYSDLPDRKAIVLQSIGIEKFDYSLSNIDSLYTQFIHQYHMQDGCTTMSQLNPAVVSTGINNEDLIIVYESFCIKENGHESGLYAAFLYNTENLNHIVKIYNSSTPNIRMNPAIAAIDSNIVIVWEKYTNGFPMQDIYARGIVNGTMGDIIRINNYIPALQKNPAIAALTDKTFIIAWESYGQDKSLEGIYARKIFIDAFGNILKGGLEFNVNTQTLNAQKNPAIAPLSDGKFIISWDSRGEDCNVEGIFLQEFFKDTSKKGGEMQVNIKCFNAQKHSAIIVDGYGDVIIAWDSRGQDGSVEGVYARILEDQDQSSFTNNVTYIPTSTSIQVKPCILSALPSLNHVQLSLSLCDVHQILKSTNRSIAKEFSKDLYKLIHDHSQIPGGHSIDLERGQFCKAVIREFNFEGRDFYNTNCTQDNFENLNAISPNLAHSAAGELCNDLPIL